MRIRQVILQTSRLQELVQFYAEQMELPVTIHDKDISIRIGSSELVFQPASTADPFYHFAITIPANKINEAREWLLRKNISLLRMPEYKSDVADFSNWNAKSVYFFDPAGNIVELIARFDLNNGTGQLFSARQFLSISEIGIVAEENKLEEVAESFRSRYALDWFAKQPPLPHFKVIGNDEGLFIFVPEKRNWYPTSIPSGIFPLEVHFAPEARSFTWRAGL